MNQPRQRNLKAISGSSDGGDVWAPMAVEKNGFSFNPDDENNKREGYLLEVREGVGKNGSTIYVFHRADENGNLYEKFSLWEDTVLGDRIEKVINSYGIGAYCVIEYKGRKHKKGVPPTSPWSQTNSFHIWEVLVVSGAPAYDPGKQVKPGNPAAGSIATQTPIKNTVATAQTNANPVQQQVPQNNVIPIGQQMVNPNDGLPF
jgi:hypothetical protein